MTDAIEQRARRDLELHRKASARIGISLDVRRTAQDLVDVLVPALADLGWVNLAEAVLDGDEPPPGAGGGELHLRCVAMASATGVLPPGLLRKGDPLPPLQDTELLRKVQRGETVLANRDEGLALAGDPDVIKLVVPDGGHSSLRSPLFARGVVLGALTLWRTDRREPFDQDDAELLAEITARAAVSIDNARRYTREHNAALTLQQRLLPPATTGTTAAETAGASLPAGGDAGISGDWFDVIPLPSLRTALVVGDVVGHGLHAGTTMGRLRTAVKTLADLELAPDELLTHLDDLVMQLAAEAPDPDGVGASCLYAVYDPVAGRCTLAGAGHPPPVLRAPDGSARVVEFSPGPPLGVGGLPFESATFAMPPGSVLCLYTDGLLQDFDTLDAGIRHLTRGLTELAAPGRDLDAVGRSLLEEVRTRPRHDDVALLLTRVRGVPPGNSASWEFPGDPAAVSDARRAVTRQLAAWNLDEAAFATELVVSELVTNAVRYAGGPVGLRLVRDHVLVCEVTDPSNTPPRLRRARANDEGGRGLFLVAQLATRWGCRYGQSGKTIWVEQPLRPEATA